MDIPDYPALFSALAAANITVDGLRQTIDGKWCAQLAVRYHTDGRHLQHICDGLSPYEALANCASLIEWSKANPPAPRTATKGTLADLLSIVAAAPKFESLSEADVKSLKL